MEAGYDYMLLRGSKRRQPNTLTGIFLVILGSMLITTSLAYHSYTDTARADLVNLEATLPGAVSADLVNLEATLPVAVSEVQASVQDTSPNPGQQVLSRTAWPERTIAQPAPRENTPGAARSNPVEATIKMAEKPAIVKTGADITVVSTKEMSTVVEGLEDALAPVLAPVEKQADTPTLQPDTLALVEPGSSTVVEAGLEDLATSETGLNPNAQTLPVFWSDRLSYESAPQELQTLLEAFTPVGAEPGFPLGSRAASTRLAIPSVEIDAHIVELAIEELGSCRAYETPDRAAGHIPATANAGEAGSAWFFGHTETPLLGEGSIFFNLVQIPEMLKQGRDVFVIAESEEGQYLYRLISSQVVHEQDIRLYDAGGATIHLVSCVPRLVYDHRLIVSGELIGQV